MQFAGEKMEAFSKQLNDEREADRIKDEKEGTEVSDEVKNERAKRRLEQHQRQIK